ncbi:uncharacterized protein MYCGRDRAFT_82501, partial [Zymoseptoria tritici IPO323]
MPSGNPIQSYNYTIPYSTGSSVGSPITASAPSSAASTGAIPTYSNLTSSATLTSFVTFTILPTGSPAIPSNSTASTPFSPITASLNGTSSGFASPTGTGSPITASAGFPTAYPFPIVSTGVPSSPSGSLGSPISPGNSTSSASVTDSPTLPTDAPGGTTTVFVTVFPTF